MVVFAPTWAWCAERLGLHRVRTLTGPPLDLLRALVWTQAWGVVAIAVILAAAQVSLNRSFIAVFLVLSTGLLGATVLAQRAWIGHRRGRALALFVGPDDGDAVAELERLRGRQVEWLVSVDPAALRERLRTGGVDEVVLPGTLLADKLQSLLLACEEVGVPGLVRVERLDLRLARPRAEVVGPTLYLAYQTAEPDRPALLVKSILDRLAAAGFLVVVSPLFGAVALLVKLTSPGPVLFVQRRAGLNGRAFPMLKFRTMRVGAEAERDELLRANELSGPIFKMTQDPRVTPVGRFLRKTSLDELPQLVNVLGGHMSLVGPRPLPLVENWELVPVHRRRLSVKPGITGLWQVSGRNDLTFEEWMALDLQYVDNWSLGLDLAILLRTLPTVLGGTGAR
jgi:exopolysaccharide biosynthesis polyprenyl glycosylphosphotransferase